MPVYRRATKEKHECVFAEMELHHPHLHDVELTVDILEAWPRLDDHGNPTQEALKHAGYPCLAVIKIRGPKDRGQGLGDVLLTVFRSSPRNWKRLPRVR